MRTARQNERGTLLPPQTLNPGPGTLEAHTLTLKTLNLKHLNPQPEEHGSTTQSGPGTMPEVCQPHSADNKEIS